MLNDALVVNEPELLLSRFSGVIGGPILPAQGNPRLDSLPQAHGVALRAGDGRPVELPDGKRRLLPVGRGNQLTLEADVAREGDGRGGTVCRLPLQDRQPLIHAAHLLPFLRAERGEERGLHLGERHGIRAVIERACGNAAGQIVTIREGVIAAGRERAGLARVLAGDRPGVIAAGDVGAAPGEDTRRVGARADGAGVVAVGDAGVTVVVAADDTARAVAGRDAAAVIAACDGHGRVIVLGIAEDAADVAAAGDVGLIAAVFNDVRRADGAPGDAARVAAAAAGAGDGALYHDIPDLRVLDDAEQTRVLCGDVQSGDGVALSVEAAGELVRAHADGREGKAAEINVVRQDGADLRAAALRDGVREPRQLLAAFDLVGRGLRARAVGGLLRRAVPRAGGRQLDGDICGAALVHREVGARAGVALGLDEILIVAVGQAVAAIGFRRDGLSVPENRHGGVRVRRGDRERDAPARGGGERDALVHRAALHRQLAGLFQIAEGADTVGIRAVRQRKDPAALRVRAGLAVDRDLGARRVDHEGHGIGRHLPAQDGIAVVEVGGGGKERIAQRGGERLELIGGLGGRTRVRRQAAEIVAVFHRAGGLVADNGMAVGAIGDLRLAGRVAVLHGGGAAREIGGDAARAIAAGRAAAAVVAAVHRHLTVDVADDAARVMAAGGHGPGVDAAGDLLRGGAVPARDIADDAADVLPAVYGDVAAAVADRARLPIELAGDAARAVAAAAVSGQADAALYGDVFDGGAVHIAEQTRVRGGAAGDGQAGDGVPLSVEAALEGGGVVFADGRPLLAAEVDVIAEHGARAARAPGVHLLRQPRKLAAAGDLIGAVRGGGGLADVALALPRSLVEECHGDRLRAVLRHGGEVDRAGLLGVVRAAEAPAVAVPHGQAVGVVRRRGHDALTRRNGQLRALRRLVIGEGHRHDGARLHGDVFHRVLAPHGHGAGEVIIAEGRRRVGVRPTHDGVDAVRVGRQRLIAAHDGQCRALRQTGEGQLVRVRRERYRFGDIAAANGDGAALGGVVAAVCDAVGIAAHRHVREGVIAVRADRLLLPVPCEDGVGGLDADGDGVGRVGVDILPAEDGIPAVDRRGEIRAEGIAERPGRGLQLVGARGGDAGLGVVLIALPAALIKAVRGRQIVAVDIGEGITVAGAAAHVTGREAVCERDLVAAARGKIAQRACGRALRRHLARDIAVRDIRRRIGVADQAAHLAAGVAAARHGSRAVAAVDGGLRVDIAHQTADIQGAARRGRHAAGDAALADLGCAADLAHQRAHADVAAAAEGDVRVLQDDPLDHGAASRLGEQTRVAARGRDRQAGDRVPLPVEGAAAEFLDGLHGLPGHVDVGRQLIAAGDLLSAQRGQLRRRGDGGDRDLRPDGGRQQTDKHDQRH